MATTTMTMQGYDNVGIFLWSNIYIISIIRIQSQSQIVSFFSEKGTNNSQYAADCQSENFKYKNWMSNAQISKDNIRGRVEVNNTKAE